MTVTSIHHRSEAADMVAAAARIRDPADDFEAADLADLIEAIGRALRTVADPPLSETEMWRWSAVVCHARRITRAWSR